MSINDDYMHFKHKYKKIIYKYIYIYEWDVFCEDKYFPIVI